MTVKGFNPATDYPDQPRWFDALGPCRGPGCSKPGAGLLRGPSNESYGAYCVSCANKRLKRAKAERDAVAAYQSKHRVLDVLSCTPTEEGGF